MSECPLRVVPLYIIRYHNIRTLAVQSTSAASYNKQFCVCQVTSTPHSKHTSSGFNILTKSLVCRELLCTVF